ncbi:MAG: S41 family peptidase [Prevotellaceae bacterium]|jgi:hypothetical protein|nr:S41 family peptidase [Prevotellaceae bacterium]
MRFILLLMLLSTSSSLNAQPSLSKHQMKEDISFLATTIKDVCPHLRIREHVTGVCLTKSIDSLVQIANKCQDFENFYYLVQQILFLTQDQHNVISSFYYADLEEDNPTITEQSLELGALCEMDYVKYHPAGALLVEYSDGRYYFGNDQYHTNGKLAIPGRAELIAINNIPIKTYIEKYNRPVDNSIRWDFTHDNFYTHRIYLPRDYGGTISYKTEYDTLQITIQPFSIMSNRTVDAFDFNVFFDDEEKLLYIRIPSMDMDELSFLTNEMLAYKDETIAKVIIDIRGNGGGNDNFWIDVLRTIRSESISTKEKCYIRNTKAVLDYAQKYRNIEISDELVLYCEQEFVKISADSTTTYEPAVENLNYNGNIYAIVNDHCFSSALAFSAFCNRNNGLITVGEPSGYIGGRGITPFFFELPNSHLVFTLSPVLDASYIEEPIDFYDHKVDVLVKQPLEEIVFERNLDHSTKRYSKSYLYKNDSVFKAVLSL